MDQFYQILYGPTEDKLKYCGAAWLALSLVARFAGSDITGFIGLLAVLAVVVKSDYLLFLLLVFAPLSLLLSLIYLWREPRTFWLVLLQLLHAVVQVHFTLYCTCTLFCQWKIHTSKEDHVWPACLCLALVMGLSIWFAWQWFQEVSLESGSYQAADNGPASRQGAQPAHSDPFQNYVPPQSQQSSYHQEEQEQRPIQPSQAEPQREKSENLL